MILLVPGFATWLLRIAWPLFKCKETLKFSDRPPGHSVLIKTE